MTTRSEIAAAFRAAKPFLSRTAGDGRSCCICAALFSAEIFEYITDEQAKGAVDVIHDRISPHTYATNWLANALGKDVLDVHDPSNYDDVQDWRHRWLDSLIREFSKE